ncbi:MAG: hypothetical protein R6X20_02335 [Phycisphaerae bacterium]
MASTRVELLRRMAGPSGNYPAGSVLTLSQAVAEKLIASGQARAAGDKAETAEAPPAAAPVETAEAPAAAETAAADSGSGNKGGRKGRKRGGRSSKG